MAFHPAECTFSFFPSTVMLEASLFIQTQRWLSDLDQGVFANSLPHLDYGLMQPIAEKRANLPFKFVFVILPFQLRLCCKAIPAVPSRLRQTQRNINANTV